MTNWEQENVPIASLMVMAVPLLVKRSESTPHSVHPHRRPPACDDVTLFSLEIMEFYIICSDLKKI